MPNFAIIVMTDYKRHFTQTFNYNFLPRNIKLHESGPRAKNLTYQPMNLSLFIPAFRKVG
jgi:hypothetical protein